MKNNNEGTTHPSALLACSDMSACRNSADVSKSTIGARNVGGVVRLIRNASLTPVTHVHAFDPPPRSRRGSLQEAGAHDAHARRVLLLVRVSPFLPVRH